MIKTIIMYITTPSHQIRREGGVGARRGSETQTRGEDDRGRQGEGGRTDLVAGLWFCSLLASRHDHRQSLGYPNRSSRGERRRAVKKSISALVW